MYSKLKLSELKSTTFKTKKIIFFIKLTKVLEVANFIFLANFRFLTLPINFHIYPSCGKNIVIKMADSQ